MKIPITDLKRTKLRTMRNKLAKWNPFRTSIVLAYDSAYAHNGNRLGDMLILFYCDYADRFYWVTIYLIHFY